MRDKSITRKISQGMYILTTVGGGCCVDAVSQISGGDNPLIGVAVMKKNYTNKLMKDTNTDFKVIKRMMTGELLRFDIIVLARFCDYLNCSITDIIEYFPNKK